LIVNSKIIIECIEINRNEEINTGQIHSKEIVTVEKNRFDDRLRTLLKTKLSSINKVQQSKRTNFIALIKPKTLLKNKIESTEIFTMNEFVGLSMRKDFANRAE